MRSRTRLLFHRFLVLCLLAVANAGAWAQLAAPVPVRLRVIVRDAKTQAAIPYALLILESDERGYLRQASTDRLGKFVFEGLGRDVFIVRVKQPGYLEASRRVDLTIASSDYISFDLKADPKASPGVLIPPEGPGATISAIPVEAEQEFKTGQKLIEEGKVGDSVAHLKKAVSLHPSYLEAHLALGTAYLDQGNLADALQHLKRAIEINEQLPGAHLALGAAYNRQKDFPAAEKALLRGLELAPESPEGHFEIARTYLAVGKWPEAETHASKCAQLKPDEPVIHVVLGNIMLKKRDNRTALAEFKEYLRLAPNGPMAAGARDMVAKLEKVLSGQQP